MKTAQEYFNEGNKKTICKDYTGAIAEYNKSIEIDPKLADAYFNRGVVKAEIQDQTGAILDFTMALEIKPRNADAYFNRGVAKYKLHDISGANSDYTKALEIDPHNTKAINNIRFLKLVFTSEELHDFTQSDFPKDCEKISQYKKEPVQKVLSNENVAQIFNLSTLTIHFVPENKIPNDFNPCSILSINSQNNGEYETGKYHLILKFIAPESLTGISQNKEDVVQEWELLESQKSNLYPNDRVYVFKAWGRTSCFSNNFCDNQHHEGKQMFIDREFFETKIIAAMYLDDRISNEKLKNVIGMSFCKSIEPFIDIDDLYSILNDIKTISFDEESKSKIKYESFLATRGLRLILYDDHGESTYTLIFSKNHNPLSSYSFMNKNFLRFIKGFGGSLLWKDGDNKKIIHLSTNNEFGDQIAWESFILELDYNNKDMQTKLKIISDFMQKFETYLIQKTNNPTPKIVITFEDLFFLKHSYKIIDNDFTEINLFDNLPIYNFPYKEALVI